MHRRVSVYSQNPAGPEKLRSDKAVAPGRRSQTASYRPAWRLRIYLDLLEFAIRWRSQIISIPEGYLWPVLRTGMGAAADPAEFRTAPLWGLGERIFFLHDGRTSSLLTAI